MALDGTFDKLEALGARGARLRAMACGFALVGFILPAVVWLVLWPGARFHQGFEDLILFPMPGAAEQPYLGWMASNGGLMARGPSHLLLLLMGALGVCWMVAPFFRDRPRVEKGPRWYILLGMGLTCFFPLGFALWVLWYWWSGRSLSKEEAKARKKAYNSALRRIFSVPAMLIVLGGFAMFDRASMVRAYDGWDISSQDRLVVQPAKVTGLLAMETRREAQHQLSPVQRDVYHYGAAQAAWLALDRPGVTRHLGAMTGTWRPDPTNARRIGFMAAQVEGTLSAPSRVMLAKVGVDQAAERLCQMIRHATLAFGLTLLMLSAYSFHLSRHTGRYVQTTRLRLFQIRALQEAAA